MPVAPYTTASVPASRPPPSMSSSFIDPVLTRGPSAMAPECTLPFGGCSALRLELSLVEPLEFGQSGGLTGRLVVPDAGHAGEAEGEAGAVRRALLDLVVLDLDDHLGPHPHRVAIIAHGQMPEPFGHGRELAVGKPLEGLANVRPSLTLAHRQMIVGEPSHASTRSAVDGDDHAVDRVGGLELEPALAPSPRLVGRAQILGHHAFVTGGQGALTKLSGSHHRVDGRSLGQIAPAGESLEGFPACRVRLVDEGAPLGHQAVEEVQG